MKQKRSLMVFLPGLKGIIPLLFAVTQLLCACTELANKQADASNLPAMAIPLPAAITRENNAWLDETADPSDVERISVLLDQLAELERSGLFQPGMASIESALRERIGDYGGATIAAFKEMSWAYGYGSLEKFEIEEGVERIIALEEQPGTEIAVQAAQALHNFIRGRWNEAEHELNELFIDSDEIDSFANWVILSCALEKDPANRKSVSIYRAIRARYTQFPEYWYRGARAFSGIIAAEYAEQCINLAPVGPFAAECRSILASYSGLKPEDGPAIKSKIEIENLISQAVNMGNPALLEPLMPLIDLPENPFTVYAIGALQSLAVLPHFRDYFTGLAAVSNGRLSDRLAYICRS